MTRSDHNPMLNRFAVLTAVATLALIGIGGLVTSKGVGMSVPDWPTSYGYNMFLFPISMWRGGIFYEHTHRLAASVVGFLTVILAVWLWLKDCRAAVRWLGVLALFAVVLQGVLGGLRVVLLKDQIGIVHAALAQTFLVLVSLIALVTSKWWAALRTNFSPAPDSGNLRRFFLCTTLLIFTQLVLGATMRHQHAGLAIPDFPLAYHKLWPPMDAASVALYNQNRLEVSEPNPITAFQIGLQMAHRLLAALILCAVAFCAWSARHRLGARHPLARLAKLWLGLIVGQVILGAVTIWSGKAADVATLHVVVGALSLVTAAFLTAISIRVLIPARVAVPVAVAPAQTAFMTGKPAASGIK